MLAILVAYVAYQEIYKNFYLDKGLELKVAEGKTENIAFLNRYGVMGTFINNDIRLLKRSKAAKSALIASTFFLFYGLLTFTKGYQNGFMQLFTGIFVTGGFMPVSYTHLDVYKRQTRNGISGNSCLDFRNFTILISEPETPTTKCFQEYTFKILR